MKSVKLLIIIILLSVFSIARGQINDDLLEKIDFNDTTLVDSDFLKTTISDYITSAQNPDLSPRNQMYDMIIATDNVLRNCTVYPMYKFVFQYLIYGFSELGANIVVDYMMRLPYFEYVDATAEQKNEILEIAESYNRVKIGAKAANIQSVTIKNTDFNLYSIDSKYTIVLFWSYSCPHCRDLIKELSGFVRKNEDFSVVTVAVSDNIKKVKRFLKKTHFEEYYNICDGKGWNSPIVEAYAVDMTPSVFLLDKNKIIIAKPFDIEELINEIER